MVNASVLLSPGPFVRSRSVLLLDEPTASLDLSHQIRIMDLMEKLKAEKQITIVMVSHDVNLAAMYGNRLLLLDKGCIAEIGPPREVLTYQNLERSYGCTLTGGQKPPGGCSQGDPCAGEICNPNNIAGRYYRTHLRCFF